jgi:hypothetical protein
MTMNETKLMYALAKIAEAVDPIQGARIAAAIVLNGSILSIGTNKKKTHPLQARYAADEHKLFLHAEIDAIQRAFHREERGDYRPTHSTLYVCRAKFWPQEQIWGWGLARPCQDGCLCAARDFGLEKVVYSVDCIGGGRMAEWRP